MQQVTKWVVGTAGVIGALALLSGSRLQRFAKEFIVTVAPRIHEIDWNGLTLAVDITFKNPTDAVLTLKHPTVTLFDSLAAKKANQPFLSSTVSDNVRTIRPNSETTLEPVFLKISVLDFGVAKAAVTFFKNYYFSNVATSFYARALTQVNGAFPIVQEYEWTFQRNVAPKSNPLPTAK